MPTHTAALIIALQHTLLLSDVSVYIMQTHPY